jgi:hypothetical protein
VLEFIDPAHPEHDHVPPVPQLAVQVKLIVPFLNAVGAEGAIVRV